MLVTPIKAATIFSESKRRFGELISQGGHNMIESHRQVLGIAAVLAISGFVFHAAYAQTKDQVANKRFRNNFLHVLVDA